MANLDNPQSPWRLHRPEGDPLLLPPTGTAYRLSSQLSEEDVPLLMRFMHKPLRSGLELKRASDPTRRNSLLNASLGHDGADEFDLEMHLDETPNDAANGAAASAVGAGAFDPSANGGYHDHQRTRSDSSENSAHGDDDNDPDIEPRYRLVRKKLGEIVKSLLKDALTGVNRSRSLPLTPTYKQVHFGGDTDVRYFKQKDRPAAISAQNSPTLEGQDDGYNSVDFASSDDDSEDLGRTSYFGRGYGGRSYDGGSYFGLLLLEMLYDDYYDDELNSHVDRKTSKYKNHLDKTHYPKVEWQLELLNVPLLLYQEKIMLRHMPVFLEQTFLSIDKKYLLGQIAVRNLSYEKSVTVRYTCDGWATIVEIPTIYVPDPPAILRTHNYDRFVFKILLDLLFTGYVPEDSSKLDVMERKYDLCVRYATGQCEFWDNNENKNYLIKLKRSERAVDGTSSGAPAAAPPKQMPPTARSKQQAHIRKPKYSSSYLKRIVSEPLLSTSSEVPGASTNLQASEKSANSGQSAPIQSPLPVHTPKVVQPNFAHDYNDFEKNNYYLSSPLLLSLKNKDIDDHPFGRNPRLARVNAERRTPSPTSSNSAMTSSIDSLSDDISPTDETSPPEDVLPSQVSPKTLRNRRVDSMSYKELLDSYCFFSTTGGNGSSTTLVLSDDPPLRYDNKNQLSDTHNDRNIDSDNAFTVSSFLRN